MKSRWLQQHDVKGKVISRVLQTPWVKYGGTDCCLVFVEFEDGLIFKLGDYDREEDEIPVGAAGDLVPAAYPDGMRDCVGQTAVAVLFCPLWPSVGLALDDGRVLCCRDRGTPFIVGAYIYDPPQFEKNEAVDYWTGKSFWGPSGPSLGTGK